MLISPHKLHRDLTSILISTPDQGPHTVLLILPQGRLLASSSVYDQLYNEELEVEDASGGEDPDVGSLEINNTESHEDAEDVGEEPYLDEPERLRLLCGLASQWEEDESPRVECELGRLLLVPIPLPRAEVITTMAQNLPATKGLQPEMFVLVLNGTKGTAWADLTVKADDFQQAWKTGPGA